MPILALSDIKKENTRKVLDAIARKIHISKLEISEETGLSLMTVGKIVNSLGSCGLITRSKDLSPKAGRHAELFRIRHDWLIPVFEIASHVYKFYITDLEGNVVEKLEYDCTREGKKAYATEFLNFLHLTLDVLRKKYKHHKALGIGVSVSGIYDSENDKIVSSMKPELSGIKLMTNISKIFRQKNVVIDNANRLCAEGIINGSRDYRNKTITCITVSDYIEATTCQNGVYIKGAHNVAGRLGDLPFTPALTYANFLRNAQIARDTFSPILDLIKFSCVAYDPDMIFLCTDKFCFTPDFTKRLNDSLKTGMLWVDKPPEIHTVNTSTIESLSGIISRVISNWLDKYIVKSE